ncbi:MAG: phage protein GemA/Gp16 family protein [Bacilli bacterium]
MDRKSLLAVIHIAKNNCFACEKCGALTFHEHCSFCQESKLKPLTEKQYKKIIKTVSGKESCSLLSDIQLSKVMDVFNKAGFKEEHPYVSPKKELYRERRRVVASIQIRAPVVLGEHWKQRLDGFIRTQVNSERLEWCDMKELRKIYGWINRTDKYSKK